MVKNKPHFKKLLIATYITSWLMALLTSAAPAYASGEQYTWVDQYTITATKGQISGTATFTDNLGMINGSPSGALSSEFNDVSGCKWLPK